MKLLEIAKKFGVKPSKVIGTQGNVVPYKKPSLVDIRVDEFKLKESVDKGGITMDKVQQEMEETVKLALSKNLNDVELNRALNNAVNLDRVFFPPMAEVVEAGSKQQVTGKGLEELIDKEGLVASPKTPLGKIQFGNKRAEQEMNKIIKESDLDSLLKGIGKDQLSEIRLHNEGLVRAVTRQILSEDIKAGKIKSLTLDDLGTSREPIDYFRKIYGENALEQLDSLTPEFNRLNTEQEAAKLARTKFKFDPDETRIKGSMSYDELQKTIEGSGQPKEAEVLNITTEGNKRKSIDDLIDEYNANQDRLRLTDQEGGTEIGYQEFQDIQKRNEDIAKALEEKGISSTIEEEVKPEGIVIPFRKKFTKPEPEGKAQGGIIGYALGGRTGFNKGKRVLDLIAEANKKLKGKKSMESVNPKTGEVTVPKEPIKPAEGITVMDQEPDIVDEKSILKNKKTDKSRQLTREEISDYEEQLGDSETWMSEGTVEEAEKVLKRSKAEEAYYLQQYKMGKLDPVPGEQTQSRMDFLRKKAEYAEDVKDRRLFTLDEMNELDELEKIFEPSSSNSINISDPKTAESFTNFARENDPEGFKKIQKIVDDINNKNALKEFDPTGRKPNAKGGPARGLDYLMGF